MNNLDFICLLLLLNYMSVVVVFFFFFRCGSDSVKGIHGSLNVKFFIHGP